MYTNTDIPLSLSTIYPSFSINLSIKQLEVHFDTSKFDWMLQHLFCLDFYICKALLWKQETWQLGSYYSQYIYTYWLSTSVYTYTSNLNCPKFTNDLQLMGLRLVTFYLPTYAFWTKPGPWSHWFTPTRYVQWTERSILINKKWKAY